MKRVKTIDLISDDDDQIPEGEFEVEKILKMRKKYKNGKFCYQFLIKWVGYTQCTWEPVKNLTHCDELLIKFLEEREQKIYFRKRAKDAKKRRKRKLGKSLSLNRKNIKEEEVIIIKSEDDD